MTPLPADPALPWLQGTSLRLWRLLFVALLVGVTWLALVPQPPQIGTGWDKSNHLLAFSALTVVGALAGALGRRWRTPLAVGLLAFGALIELLQSQIPGRSGEWSDLLADALGISLGLLATAALAHACRGRTSAAARR